MSDSPPNDELRALLALEKEAATDPGEARARLAARLAPILLAPDPGPPAAAPPRRAPGWRIPALTGLGLFGAGLAVGAAIRGAPPPPAKSVEIRYVDRIVEVDRTADSGASPVAPPPITAASGPSAPPRSERPPLVVSAAASASSPDDQLARERQIIDKARSALARRDADAALAAVAEHARSFPRGQLVEMREALAVQALVQGGRGPEARARAERFHRTFPASMYSPVVDSALSSIP
jgi:hypothetical protein